MQNYNLNNLYIHLWECQIPFSFAGSSTFSCTALAFLLCRIIVDCCRRCQWHPAPPVYALVLTFTGLLSECRNSLDDTEGLKLRPVGGQEPRWNVFAQIITVWFGKPVKSRHCCLEEIHDCEQGGIFMWPISKGNSIIVLFYLLVFFFFKKYIKTRQTFWNQPHGCKTVTSLAIITKIPQVCYQLTENPTALHCISLYSYHHEPAKPAYYEADVGLDGKNKNI